VVSVLPSKKRVKKLRKQLDLLEKEIINLKGEKKKVAAKEYFRLLHLCKNECQVDEPIYFNHS
jgi:hypothetical protein